jgi:hypothetical protein
VNPLVFVPEPVSGFVTTTSRAPAVPAGVVALSDVELLNTTPVADAPPTVTVAPDWKPVPVIVIDVPPLTGPELGDTVVTVGSALYVNAFVFVTEPVSGFVTTTFLAPAVPAGVVAVIVVEFTTVTPVADAPPTVTVAPVWKPVPVIVIGVPPVTNPELGDTVVIVGSGL